MKRIFSEVDGMAVEQKKQDRLIETLNGFWSFCLDPQDKESWNHKNEELPVNTIKVPGSWEEQGFGETSGHFPIGTWKKDREYEGVAWYVKDITLPQEFDGRHTFLILKGVRWFTEVWIDGNFVSKGESLVTPHRFNITPFIKPGAKHRLVIKVDNRISISLNESHIHSYHTATNWGGITGGIELEGIRANSFEDLLLQSNTAEKSICLHVKINRQNLSDDNSKWSLKAKVKQANGTLVAIEERAFKQTDDTLGHFLQETLEMKLGENAECWSPKHPCLYQVELTITKNGECYDSLQMPFGLRTLEASGNQLLLNQQPIFLTGYVDCCIFPQTGYPVWDIEHYRKQFKIAKSYGFNHVRLHGWSAPEPFWQAADEEGMLVQAELPHWSEWYRDRKQPAPEEVHQFLTRELERILTYLQVHPSFVMLSLGNELISEEGHPELNSLVQLARKIDPTRLYTDNTGYGHLPANDREGDYYIPTLNWHPPYHINQAALPDSTLDFSDVTRLENKPLIAHEHGQFTMYVRPEEAKEYKGVIKPYWLNTINETLEAKGLMHRVNEFIEATGVHMGRALKEAMEKARRTPNLAGIQLLDIRDFPGQGHATVGILDVFWNSKNVITPGDFRKFNEQTVLLMRSKRRTFFMNEIVKAKLEVSHFGKDTSGQLKWTLISGPNTIQEGTKTIDYLPAGGLTELIDIQVAIPNGEARKLVLSAELKIDGEAFHNQWDFWVFPRPTLPGNTNEIWTNCSALRAVLFGARFERTIGMKQYSYHGDKNVKLAITNRLSRDVLQFLIDGGSVWLMAEKDQQHDEILTKYLPIFWNYLWFPEQTGTTMGMMIHPHPAVKNFPHDQFSDWHWYHLVNHSIAINLDSLPKVKPIVEVIDNFNRAKRLAYAFEARIGKGKLFVSTFNFTNANTMKLPEVHSLFHDLIQYLNSPHFQPDESITVGELLGIFKIRSL